MSKSLHELHINLQPVLGGSQHRELIAGAQSPEIVVRQIGYRNAGQSVRSHVGRLCAGRIRIFVAHPQPKLAVGVGQTVRIGTGSMCRIADLAQWCGVSAQIAIAGVRQEGANLEVAEQTVDAGLGSGRSGGADLVDGWDSGDGGVGLEAPRSAVRWDGNDDLVDGQMGGNGGSDLGVNVGRLGTVVGLVERCWVVRFLRVASWRLEVVRWKRDKVDVGE